MSNIVCPDCGTNLQSKIFDIDWTNLEECDVCDECGYGYPANHWFGKEDSIMTKLACEVEMVMLHEREDILQYCVKRDWHGFNSPLEYLKDLDPETEDENTFYEQWLLAGMQKAIDIINNFHK